jgi:type III pantothenate kinase
VTAPTLLAADIGNSHTVLGLIRGGDVSADWRVATLESRTADEWAVLIRGLVGDRLRKVQGIVVCASTSPTCRASWWSPAPGPAYPC